MDVVLGAGIVGVSVALNLQEKEREVVLADRAEPGLQTSFGNAGLIESSDLVPRSFPRDLGEIAHYATGSDVRARFAWTFLPALAPWLFSYWNQSAPARLKKIGVENAPLYLKSLTAHKRLMTEAGALHLLRDDGWLHLYRSMQVPAETRAAVELAHQHGIRAEIIDGAEVAKREPTLLRKMTSAVHWRDAATLSDPYALTKALVDLFVSRGGQVVKADAATLNPGSGRGWTLKTGEGTLSAERVVVALGPWSDEVTKKLGYRIPLGIKRGYHMHYAFAGDTLPTLPVIDVEYGYVLSPMSKGIRLTTGIEFDRRDAPPTPVQLDRNEPFARQLLPLGDRVDPEPWLGRRPTMPDMKPVIGPAHRHRDLWFAFGHGHHGLTLGPITGEALAAQMAGETPPVDLAPFAPARFG